MKYNLVSWQEICESTTRLQHFCIQIEHRTIEGNAKTSYFWIELKHQLIARQEVFFREQLHVLTYVFDILYWVNLTKRKLLSVMKAQMFNRALIFSQEYLDSYLLLIVKLIGLNLLNLLVYSECISRLKYYLHSIASTN